MGARVVGTELAKTIADAYLDVAFDFDPKGPSGGNVLAIEAVDAKYACRTDSNAAPALPGEAQPRR
jgi:ribose 5-phosphate isomerase B